MTTVSAKYNAKIGLGDFNPAAEREFGSKENNLVEGSVVVFNVHPEGKVKKWIDKEYPMIMTDTNIECHAPYVGSCMINNPALFLNKDLDVKYHCMHNARTGEALNLTPLVKHLDADDCFPKVKVIATLPIAIKRADLLTSSDEVKTVYADYFGVKLEDMQCEYLPSVKKSKYSSNGGVFSTKLSVVELVD